MGSNPNFLKKNYIFLSYKRKTFSKKKFMILYNNKTFYLIVLFLSIFLILFLQCYTIAEMQEHSNNIFILKNQI